MAKKTQRKRKSKWTVEEALLAKRAAVLYRRKVKATNIHTKLTRFWRVSEPIESQDVFKYFVKLAQLLTELEVEPREWITAQFEEWNGPSRTMPMPNQLVSFGAVQRYDQWMLEREAEQKGSRKMRALNGEDVLRNDKRKLRRFREAMENHQGKKISTKKILRSRYQSFSRAFLETKGIWDEVSDSWLARRGDK